jgi:hypothetical protein
MEAPGTQRAKVKSTIAHTEIQFHFEGGHSFATETTLIESDDNGN